MANVPPGTTVSGKKLVLTTYIGFIVFAVLGPLLVWLIAQWTTPYFEEQMRRQGIPDRARDQAPLNR